LATSAELLKQLSDDYEHDALTLLVAGGHGSAFHLAGLAVEMAIKACIAMQFPAHSIPDRRLIARIYDHDLGNLMRLARLWDELDLERQANPLLNANWKIVLDWRIESRYELSTGFEATAMWSAACNVENGALAWIRRRW
jgi:hypothetical protein